MSLASRVLGTSSISQLEQNLADIKKGPLAKELVDAMEAAGQLLKKAWYFIDTTNWALLLFFIVVCVCLNYNLFVLTVHILESEHQKEALSIELSEMNKADWTMINSIEFKVDCRMDDATKKRQERDKL